MKPRNKIIISSISAGIVLLLVILFVIFYALRSGGDSGNPPGIPIIFIMIATVAGVMFVLIIKIRRQNILQSNFEDQLYPEGKPESSFSIRIGTFDEKLGPICLNAQKNVWCDFASEKCNGVTSRNIMEALSIEKENIVFEENGTIFQGINFNFTDPDVRGHVRKYSILIKYDKKLGRIKDEIINQIREEFNQNLGFKYPITREQAVAFTERWEGILQEKKNVTDVEELKEKIKEEKLINRRSQNMWGSYGLAGLNQNRKVSFAITLGLTILLVVGMVFFIVFQSSSDSSSSSSSSSSIWVIISGVTVAILAGVFVVFSRRRQSNQMNINNNSTF